jgi:GNAT superfamily N-acetyltransferase
VTDSWLSPLRLSLDADQFRLLPRNPAFRYELHHGQVWISPRPRYYHARLDLSDAEFDGAANVPLRPLAADDWAALPGLFVRSFAEHQPFIGVAHDQRLTAAGEAIGLTRQGGDGPLIERACFVAVEDGKMFGAVLVTLLPPGDPEEFETYSWGGQPPPDAVERCEGWPHLTWVLVDQSEARCGVGTALLAAACRALQAMGFNDLLSTFLYGNDVSVMWHWRRGFRLLSYPGAFRRGRLS